MDEPRIRMNDFAEEPDRPAPRRTWLLALVVGAAVLGFGIVTSGGPRSLTDSPALDIDALDEPARDAGWVTVATLETGPWESFRIDGAYLSGTEDELVAITDDDEVIDVALPRLDVLFGAVAGPDGSVAFGSALNGPALWHSTDNRTWDVEVLPWDGNVRAVATDGEKLTVIGISLDGPLFEYVIAERSGDGWSVRAVESVPDSGLLSVPGGFVARGRPADSGPFGYLFSSDGREWIYQSDRAAAGSRSAGLVPSFVIETGTTPLLRVPNDGRVLHPPAWPVSGVWIEGDVLWLQTPGAAWSSLDGSAWEEYPINPSTGAASGYSVLLPVGNEARLAVSADDGVALMRWDPGTVDAR